jgi:AmmeMemoRadiSam system protein A
MDLSAADKKLLLHVARDSIAARLKGASVPAPPEVGAHLKERCGAFVSLHRQGRLRGCIGYLEAVKPLITTIQEMAQAAAFNDPRFGPLKPEELADLEIEISVLSPMRLTDNTDAIVIGKHGLLIARGPHRGLLLPQVATQYGWDRLTFLQQTCQKAGLPPDAWKDPATQIYTFTAEIFADHDRPSPESCTR